MMRINNSTLPNMTSPIKHVMATLHLAIVNIAPEREAEFESTWKNVTLQYLDQPEWICSVNIENQHILLSRRVIEVTWCASYAYSLLFTKEMQGKDLGTPIKINFCNNPQVHQGMKLLSWAYQNWLHGEDQPWPATLPSPIENVERGSSLWVADEFCRCSMAYILHHELAHIRLKHDPTASTLCDEREADYSAADWIMNPSLEDDDPRFIKRAIGIAVALEVLTSQGIHTGKYGGTKHPPSYDRLIHTLRRFIQNDNHVVWAVVVVTLKLHIDSKGMQMPDTKYETWIACAEDYANVLANQPLQ